MTSPTPTPYVGPRMFLEAERDRFFGRDTEARDLLALVVSERLVVFYAQSGAGKSSLVNTCLIPDLRNRGYQILKGRLIGDAPEGVRPGNIFVFNLLRSLAPKEVDSASLASQSISGFMFQHGKTLSTAHPSSGEGEAESVALIIDQFEEIFSTHDDEWEKRSGFFEQLAQALEKEPYLSVVLVMREDFIASLDPYSSLMPNRFRRRYYMQRLEHDAALEAIKEPVAEIRPFEKGVAERLVDDLSGIKIEVPGKEPITQPGQYVEAVQLQVACLKLWKSLEPVTTKTPITHADLDKIGRVDLALEEHYADRVREVAEHRQVSERAIREWFGNKLITSNGARNMVLRDTRNIQGQLNDEVIRDLLGDLVRMEQRGTVSFYELTHDRLVEPIRSNNRKWFQVILERSSVLQQKTTLWVEQKKNKTLLSTDDALVELIHYADNNPDEVTGLVQEYLDTCREKQKEVDKDREEERAKLELANQLAAEQERRAIEQARAAMWAKRATAFFLAIAAIAIATSIWAYQTSLIAKDKQLQAEIAQTESYNSQVLAEKAKVDTQKQARIAQSGALIASAADNQDESDLAMLLNLEAFKADENPRTRHELLSTLQQFENLEGFINPQSTSIVVNPNGSTLASLSPDGITLWNLTTRRKINTTPINGHSNRVYPTAINPAGTLLVTGDNTGGIVVWDLKKRRPLDKPLQAHNVWVDSLVFTPDGKYLFSASDDTTIKVWDMTTPADPKYVKTLEGHTGWIASLAVSKDGRLLASAGNDAKIFLWDISDPEKAEMVSGSPLEGHASTIYTVAFAQLDSLLISGSADGSIILWDITNPERAKPYDNRITLPTDFSSPFYSIAPSPDGDSLVAGAGSSFSLWNISDPENPELLGEPVQEYEGRQIANAYIFSTIFLDQNSFVTSSSNTTSNSNDILVWDISGPEKSMKLTAQFSSNSGVVNSLAHDSTSGTLVSGNYSGAVAFWDIANPENPAPLGKPQFGHLGKPNEIYFDTFGNVLISTGDDGPLLIDASSLQVLGFGDPNPNQLGDSRLAFGYRDADAGSNVTRIYAIEKPGVEPVTIPGTYLGTDRSVSKIAYGTTDTQGSPLINVWDLNTHQTVLTGLTGEFAFSPGGEAIMLDTTDDQGNISGMVWSTSGDGKLLARVDGEPMTVSENGKYLYYRPISKDTLRTAILEIGVGQSLSTSVEGFAWAVSPDGRYLVIASGKSNLSVLDTNTTKIVGDPIRGISIRFSDDSRFLVFYQKKAGVDYFGFLDTRTGALLGAPIAGTFENFNTIGDLVFFDYNDSTRANYIGTLDLNAGIRPTPLSGNTYLSIPDQERLLYTIDNPDGSTSLNLLDTSTGRAVGIPRQAAPIDISPDKKILLYRYINSDTGIYGIGLRNVTTGIDIGFVDSAEFVGFTADGQRLVYRKNGVEGNYLRLLDISTGNDIAKSNFAGEYIGYFSMENRVVTRSADGLINLWDISKDQLPGDELTAESPISQAVLSPDQNNLAVIQEGLVYLKDPETGVLRGSAFNHHLGGVNRALASPNGRFLLTSGEDGKAILWNLGSRTRQGSPFEGVGVGFSADSSAIVIHDPATSRVTFYSTSTLEPIRNPVAGSTVLFSPDRKYFVIVNETNKVTTVWESMTLEQMGDPIPGMNASFSPGGKFLAVGDIARDTSTLLTLEPFGIIPDVIKGASYEFNADDKFLRSVTFDYYTTIWRLTSQSARGVSNLKNMYNLYSFKFSPDGRYFYFNSEGRKELWDLYNLVTISVDLGDEIPSFSPNGKYAAIIGGDRTNLWMLSNETRVLTDLPSGRGAFSPDNRYLSVSDGTELTFVDFFDAPQLTKTVPGSDMVFSPDDKFAAVLHDKEINIYELPSLSPIRTIESSFLPSFTPDGRFLVHPDLVFDLQTQRLVHKGEGANFNVSYSPDRKSLFIFGNQGIATWEISSQTLSAPLPGHTGYIFYLVFSPNGKIIASLANDGIILSDSVTGVQLGNTFVGSSIAFNQDGKTIAISRENETILWDISNPAAPVQRGEVIAGESAMFNPAGNLVITSDMENNVTYVTDVVSRIQAAKIPGTNPQLNSRGDQLAVIAAKSSAPGGSDKDTKYQITVLDLVGLDFHEVPIQTPCPSDNACISIAFNPTGDILAYSESSSKKGPTIHIRDIENNMAAAGTIKFPTAINDLYIVNDKRLGDILIVDSDQAFILYDLDTRIRLTNLIPGGFIASTRNGEVTRLIYRNNSNGNLMFWDLMPEEWISRLCQMVGRNLTGSEWKDFDLIVPYYPTCPQWPWPIMPESAAGN